VTLKIDQTNALERKDDQMGHFNAVKWVYQLMSGQVKCPGFMLHDEKGTNWEVAFCQEVDESWSSFNTTGPGQDWCPSLAAKLRNGIRSRLMHHCHNEGTLCIELISNVPLICLIDTCWVHCQTL
jgi:hypothetical protein